MASVPARAAGKPDPYALYGHLTGKTILRPGNLPGLPDTAVIGDELPAKTNETVIFLTTEFDKAGIAIVPGGKAFTFLLLKSETNKMSSALANVPIPSQDSSQTGFQGSIDIDGGDVDTILRIYSAIRNRTVLRPTFLPSPPIYLRSKKSLNKDEVIYAMTSLLIINGLAVVDDGEKMVQIVPSDWLSMVKTNAPKTDDQAGTIDPKSVPSNKTFALNTPDLAAYYGALTGRNYMQTNYVDDRLVLFKPQTPLTTNEMLYAIQKAFTLNGLVIVDGPENSFTLASHGGVIQTSQPAKKTAKPKQK